MTRALTPTRSPRLVISDAERRAVALPWSALLRNKAHEFGVKLRGRRIKGQGMIAAPPEQVREGFAALAEDGFEEYNLPQAWVESRQIPQVLDGRVPANGATVLDLGCGPGTSTKLIAHFAQPDWTITGFDLTDGSIARARDRAGEGWFTNREGEVIEPAFECQDLAEPLLVRGVPIEDESVDLAVSGGVVGLYMHVPGARKLAAELARVIKPGGHMALDAGPSIPVPTLRTIAEQAGFVFEGLAKSFVVEPRPKLICRKPS